MDKARAMHRFKQLYDEYSWINSGKEPERPVPEKYKSVIGDLLDMVIFMDQQAKNIVALADIAVAEAREVESAVLMTEEGVILVEHLKRCKPELFPVLNKRLFNYGHA
jgi:hypothetical protein